MEFNTMIKKHVNCRDQQVSLQRSNNTTAVATKNRFHRYN